MNLPSASIDSLTLVPFLSVNVQVVLLSWNAVLATAACEVATRAMPAIRATVMRISFLPHVWRTGALPPISSASDSGKLDQLHPHRCRFAATDAQRRDAAPAADL